MIMDWLDTQHAIRVNLHNGGLLRTWWNQKDLVQPRQ